MQLDQFITDLADIPHTTDPGTVRRMSRDMSSTFSPILKGETKGMVGDIVVSPRNKDDVVRIASAAARNRMPVLFRGAGTCNFGQLIPLAGGAIVDMTALNQVVWLRDRTLRAQTGIRMIDADRHAQQQGLEMRIHPSTRHSATLGGFIAGGHVGIGSCYWGILRDRGNILGVEIVTVEEEPKIIELRGPDVNRVHHAYGTNGIITEVEMPLAPAYRWTEAIINFDDFVTAARFGVTLNNSSAIIFKLISLFAWPFQEWIPPLKKHFRQDKASVFVMIASEYLETFEWLVKDFGGEISYSAPEGEGDFPGPLYEYAFGHSGLHARRLVPNLASNLGLFPAHDLLGSIERVYKRFSHLGPLHLEMKKIDGTITCQGSPTFPYVDAAHMAEAIRGMEEEGVIFANIHTLHVKENGMKPIDEDEIAFKMQVDPYDLMNKGKFAVELSGRERSSGDVLPTSGWSYRKAG